MRVLVTGGAGFIGSHTLVEMASLDYALCSVDNFANSSSSVMDRVAGLTNGSIAHHALDIRDTAALTAVLQDFGPDAIIHFAGSKAVGESVAQPLEYYDNNVLGLISLLRAMDATGCLNVVFSSSATVYGMPQYLPYDEDHPCAPTNPYGRTKYFCEEILKDWAVADDAKSAVLLRYFNPVGAHASGMIGEDPKGVPNNLMPYIARVAAGLLPRLQVFGDDYETEDGTGLRDYVHVCDLAKAHVAALKFAEHRSGVEAINVGTGSGATVQQVIQAFERASGRPVPFDIAPRRPGDVAASVASTKKAERLLNWRAQYGLADMCESSWNWQHRSMAQTKASPARNGVPPGGHSGQVSDSISTEQPLSAAKGSLISAQ